jgi:tetratricopeptide (TPR) repeat protein
MLTIKEADRAYEYIKDVLSYFSSNNITYLEAWALRTLGNYYIQIGETATAKKAFERSLEIFTGIHSTVGQAVLLWHLGKISLLESNLVEAKRLVLKSLELSLEGGSLFQEVRCLETLVEIALLESDYNLTSKYLNRMHKSYQAEPSPFYFERLTASHDLVLENTFGVATSVAGPPNFDAQKATNYAVEQKMKWLQIYAAEDLFRNRSLRTHLSQSCQAANIKVIVHVSDPLGDRIELDEFQLAAIDELFGPQSEKYIVIHFDERLSVSESVRGVKEWVNRGYILCLENYHTLKGQDEAKRAYNKYLEVIEMSLENREGHIAAVLDIARAYHSDLDLGPEATKIWEKIFEKLTALKCRILLHLIDTSDAKSKRKSWCPLGKGIIPYEDLLLLLFSKSYPEALIFEFEDMENPLKSRANIRSFLSRLYVLNEG